MRSWPRSVPAPLSRAAAALQPGEPCSGPRRGSRPRQPCREGPLNTRKHREAPGPGPTTAASAPPGVAVTARPAEVPPRPDGSVVRGRPWPPAVRQRAGRECTDGDRHGGTGPTRRDRHRGEVPGGGAQPAGTYRGGPERARLVGGGPGLSFPGAVLGQRCPCEARSSFPVLRSGLRCAAPHRAFPLRCGVWYGEHWLTLARTNLGVWGFSRFPLSTKGNSQEKQPCARPKGRREETH